MSADFLASVHLPSFLWAARCLRTAAAGAACVQGPDRRQHGPGGRHYFPDQLSRLPPRAWQQRSLRTKDPVLLGEFRFSACGDTVTVGYAVRRQPLLHSRHSSLAQPLDLSAFLVTVAVPDRAACCHSPYADPYNNGARQETDTGTPQILQLLNGYFGGSPWSFNQVIRAGFDAGHVPVSRRRAGSSFATPSRTGSSPCRSPSSTRMPSARSSSRPARELPALADQLEPIDPLVHPIAGGEVISAPTRPPVTDGNPPVTDAGLVAPAYGLDRIHRGRQRSRPRCPRSALARAVAVYHASPTVSATTAGSVATTVGYTESPTLTGVRQPPSGRSSPDQQRTAVPDASPPVRLRADRGRWSPLRARTDQSGGIDGLLNLANQNLTTAFDFASTYEPVPASILAPPPDRDRRLHAHRGVLGLQLGAVLPRAAAGRADALTERPVRRTRTPGSATSSTRPTRLPAPPRPLPLLAGAAVHARRFPKRCVQLMNDHRRRRTADAVAQVASWYQHPFQPFVIARSRIGAFQKYVFMAYLDNLIAWGDQLYGQVDSIESINQATQLYVFASDLLGELPEQIPSPQSPIEYDYQSIQGQLDAFSNFSEMLENEFPFAGPVPSDPQSQAERPARPQQDAVLLHPAEPAAAAVLVHRGRPAVQHPPLPEHPGRAAAAGAVPAADQPAAAHRGRGRGNRPRQRPRRRERAAAELPLQLPDPAGDRARRHLPGIRPRSCSTRSRRTTPRALALLRATQETQILTLMTDMKQQQVNEANANVAALSASRAVAVTRYNYYQLLLGAGGPATPAVGAQHQPRHRSRASPRSRPAGSQLLSEEVTELWLSDASGAAARRRRACCRRSPASRPSSPRSRSRSPSMPFGIGGSGSVQLRRLEPRLRTEAVVHQPRDGGHYLDLPGVVGREDGRLLPPPAGVGTAEQPGRRRDHADRPADRRPPRSASRSRRTTSPPTRSRSPTPSRCRTT